jgi:hypothetical protein
MTDLERVAAENDEIKRLRLALEIIRIKGLPAGAALMSHPHDGWAERAQEFLDIIDEALSP